MIYALHHHHYWTEYLTPFIEDTDQFTPVASKLAPDPTYLGKKLPEFDPKKHKNILSAGRVWDQTEGNFIITRFHHSPGFGFFPTLEAYAALVQQHTTSDFRFLIYKQHYEALMTTEHLPEAADHFRYEMLRDSRVSTTEVDPQLYPFKETPPQELRKPDSALVSLNWRIVDEDLNDLKKLFNKLSSTYELTIVFHPMLIHHPEFLVAIKQIFPGKTIFNLPRHEMLKLYDAHSHIITDGSGSLYEALLRGCEPVLLDCFLYQQENQTLAAPLLDGYLTIDDKDTFLQKLFPFLYTYTHKEAKAIAREEVKTICTAAGCW